MTGEREARLAEVLAAHTYELGGAAGKQRACRCGWWPTFDPRTDGRTLQDHHRLHVGQAIAADERDVAAGALLTDAVKGWAEARLRPQVEQRDGHESRPSVAPKRLPTGHRRPLAPRPSRPPDRHRRPAMSAVLLAVAELLNEQDCHSYTLHATDSGFWTERHPDSQRDGRPNLRLTIIGRTAYETFCTAIGVTPKERMTHVGQRSWFAEADTKTRHLLVEGVSFQHHDDWQARP